MSFWTYIFYVIRSSFWSVARYMIASASANIVKLGVRKVI